jgi:hypothetical protein
MAKIILMFKFTKLSIYFLQIVLILPKLFLYLVFKIAGDKMPIAVGLCVQGAEDLNINRLSGKAVTVVSVVGDTLWASGSKYVPPKEVDPLFQMSDEIQEMIKLAISNENGDSESTTKPEEQPEGTETGEQPVLGGEEPVIEGEPVKEEESVESIADVKKRHDDLLALAFKIAVKIKVQPNKVNFISRFINSVIIPCFSN